MNKDQRIRLPIPKKGELIFGIVMIPLYLFVLPLIVEAAASLLASRGVVTLSEMTITLLPYYISFILIVIFCRNFLKDSLHSFSVSVWKSLKAVILGYLVLYLLSVVVALLYIGDMDLSANPNDTTVEALIGQYKKAMIVIAVFLAPIIEETIFRGMIFGPLYNVNPILAHAVNWLVFGCIHVVQYAVIYGDASLLIYTLDYIPASVALGWCYKRSGNIWSCVIMHMIVNLLSFWVLGAF